MRLFVDHYLATKFNATQAAIKAGYSERTAYSQGQRLLKKVEIKEMIQAKIKALLSETDKMTLEWLKDVDRIQKSDLRTVATWDEHGLTLKASGELTDDQAYPISQIKETVSPSGSVTTTIKLESKTKALDLKGRYLAILNDAPPESQTKAERMSAQERKERIAFLNSKRIEKNNNGDK